MPILSMYNTIITDYNQEYHVKRSNRHFGRSDRQPFVDLSVELGNIDRLGNKIIATGLNASLPFFTDGIGCLCNDRNIVVELFYFLRCHQSIHLRHLYIHEHKIDMFIVPAQFHRFLSVCGPDHFGPCLLQKILQGIYS